MSGVKVVVSNYCPPGQAIVMDADALGIDEGGRWVFFHPDQREVAVQLEDAIAQQERWRAVMAMVKNLAAAVPSREKEKTK